MSQNPLAHLGEIVSRDFFRQPTEDLARQLLGLILVKDTAEGIAAGRIVECEMYQGPLDKGAHSYGGTPTRRTKVMYGPPGHAYVYLIYGMYYCLNVVTAKEGIPHAILIRALSPVWGLPLMLSRQKGGGAGLKNSQRTRVASGPGKLCRALEVTQSDYGHPLWNPPLYLLKPHQPWPAYDIARGPRINIAYAEEAVEFLWRFWVYGDPHVSVKPFQASVVNSPI